LVNCLSNGIPFVQPNLIACQRPSTNCRGTSAEQNFVWGNNERQYTDIGEMPASDIVIKITSDGCTADWGYPQKTRLPSVRFTDHSITCVRIISPDEEPKNWVKFERSLSFAVNRLNGSATWTYQTDQKQAYGGYRNGSSKYYFQCAQAKKLF